MTPTVTPSASSQMLRVCFPATFMAALISRFAVQRTWRGEHDTHEIFRESADGAPQFRRGADVNAAEHRGPGRRCEGISMFRHFAPVAFLAFTMMLSILPAKAAGNKPVIEVVFVLDTTGSMGPLIEGAKRKIWSIATTLIDCSPDAEIRMGLVAYRDIGDDYVDQDLRPHHRHPGPLRRPAPAARQGRRRLAGKRQRGAVRRRHQDQLEPRPRLHPHHLPGRRRAAAHGLRAGHEIPGGDAARPRPRHHRQHGAGRRRARHRALLARDRADGRAAST